MLSNRDVMLAAAAAVVVALGTGRMGSAADANWAPSANGNKPPFDAVRGGTDTDGSPLYFCRAYYQTDYQPGKLNPTHTTCDFAYGGAEHHAPNYDVLIPHWVSASGGLVPPGSFEAGPDTDGAHLYFCRSNINQGGLQPGKLKPGAGCYIGYGVKELLVTNYQALQDDLPMTTDPFHDLAEIIGGQEANESPLPLCVTSFNGSQQPGKLVSDGLCHFSYAGTERTANLYARVALDEVHTPAVSQFDFVAGYDYPNLAPLYACIGENPQDGKTALGKYRSDFGGLCHFSYAGQEKTAVPNTTALVDGLNRVFP